MSSRNVKNSPAEASPNSAICTKLRRNKRRLSFSTSVSVRPIPHVDDLSSSQITRVWYTYPDFVRMQKSLHNSVKKFEQGKLKESSKDCQLGLDCMTKRGMLSADRRRSEARGAVLREQRDQQKGKIQDASRIAELYAEISSQSQMEASIKGLNMEADMRPNQDSTDDDDSSSSTSSVTRLKRSIFGKSSSCRGVGRSFGSSFRRTSTSLRVANLSRAA